MHATVFYCASVYIYFDILTAVMCFTPNTTVAIYDDVNFCNIEKPSKYSINIFELTVGGNGYLVNKKTMITIG